MDAKEYEGLTALVDGDIIVFRSGMAGQYTMRDVFSPKDLNNPIISFRYIKDLKEWLKKHNKTDKDFVIVDRPILEPLNRILHTTKLMMKAIEEKFKGGKPIVYLSGSDNFRLDVATELPYKGNRWTPEKREAAREAGKWTEWLDKTEEKYKPPQRPFYEQQIKQYLIKYWDAIVVNGQEADDALGIEQTLYNDEDAVTNSVIVSVDKDLKMIHGYHQDVAGMDCDPEFIDPLTADKNFYSQLISGDSVDNIPGIKGMGKVRADKKLVDCTTIEEMWDVVQQVYAEKADEVDLETLIQRGRLLWIRRKEDELWTPPEKN